MTRREPCVAIDGPAGAGKSTVSRLVANRLGYLLLDTGALYRSVALAARARGLSFDDEASVGRLSHELAERRAIRFQSSADGVPRILLEGEDVSDAIRTQDIAEGASKVSAFPEVRAALLDMQRAAAHAGAVVLEGRDIGTVVLPDAEAKFFLTGSVDVRADRRHKELVSRGETRDIEAIRKEVRDRDQRDSSRAVAPLRQADDALLVDTTNLSIDEVVDTIVRRVQKIRDRMHEPSR
jgi:cytidylate kinase